MAGWHTVAVVRREQSQPCNRGCMFPCRWSVRSNLPRYGPWRLGPFNFVTAGLRSLSYCSFRHKFLAVSSVPPCRIVRGIKSCRSRGLGNQSEGSGYRSAGATRYSLPIKQLRIDSSPALTNPGPPRSARLRPNNALDSLDSRNSRQRKKRTCKSANSEKAIWKSRPSASAAWA